MQETCTMGPEGKNLCTAACVDPSAVEEGIHGGGGGGGASYPLCFVINSGCALAYPAKVERQEIRVHQLIQITTGKATPLCWSDGILLFLLFSCFAN